ncbi:hypothetical protein [Izhakiella capsodis]|nr:hypothetical protein [Izhakiella capsodis]
MPSLAVLLIAALSESSPESELIAATVEQSSAIWFLSIPLTLK